MVPAHAAALHLFAHPGEGEQAPLPGIGPGLRLVGPLGSNEDPSVLDLPGSWPGQLSLVANQMLLWDAEPEPRQPSLLAEPPPWDAALREAAPAHRARRPARGPARGRPKPAPGQLGLFV